MFNSFETCEVSEMVVVMHDKDPSHNSTSGEKCGNREQKTPNYGNPATNGKKQRAQLRRNDRTCCIPIEADRAVAAKGAPRRDQMMDIAISKSSRPKLLTTAME